MKCEGRVAVYWAVVTADDAIVWWQSVPRGTHGARADGARADGAAADSGYDESSSSNVIWRSRPDIEALLGDFQLIEPGWTWTPEWHPEETGLKVRKVTFRTPNESVIWAGVGEKIV